MIQGDVDLHNGKLFFTSSGSGNPIVFIHGNFNDHCIWEEQIPFFSQHYQSIQYDLRGYGLSSTPQSPFSHVEDLKTLIQHLHLENIILVGSSLGGGVAVDFALIYPHLVSSLVLAAPTISGISYPISMTYQGVKNYLNHRLKGTEAAIEAFIRNHYWQYFFPSSKKEEARQKVLTNVRNSNNFCRFPPKLVIESKPAAISRLHNINIPTFIVISDGDHTFNKKTAITLNNQLSSSSIIEINGCGHLPFVEEPQQFNHKVLDFLAPSLESS